MAITFSGVFFSVLYWLISAAVLFFIILFLGHFYQPFKKKVNITEVYSLFLFSAIVDYILFIIIYLLPLIFGVRSDLVGLYDVWYMYVYVVFIILLKLLLYSVLFTLIIQPVILLSLFLYEKFIKKNSEILSKFYVSVIISFLVTFILFLFPWILGGFIAMVFF